MYMNVVESTKPETFFYSAEALTSIHMKQLWIYYLCVSLYFRFYLFHIKRLECQYLKLQIQILPCYYQQDAYTLGCVLFSN